MVVKYTSKCSNCIHFKDYNPFSVTYEYHIGCKEHYPRFWEVVSEETNECPFYESYQIELDLAQD